jgi:hypothetical protein
MKKLLLVLLLALVVGGTAAPILRNLGFAPAIAHAQDDQGEDNDDQGEDEQ